MSSRFKILLVDDNRALIDALSDILGLAGYDATCVSGGDAASAIVRDERFDCVLMDVRMPHRNGAGSFRTIRSLPH
jgi:CheY-like chemotaxis protein